MKGLALVLSAIVGMSILPRANALPSTQISLVYPVMGPRMSSDFGLRRHPIRKHNAHHHGVDLAAPQGAPIRVIAAGQVVYADPLGGYGKVIVVKHASGLTSHYGHCESIGVSIGQMVKPGDILGTVGSTGLSTGPHLHFEIRQDGKPQHPEKYLPGLDAPAAG
ncbi:MAG: hypothetical protein RL326_1702 [Pseudomonadota bacterium]